MLECRIIRIEGVIVRAVVEATVVEANGEEIGEEVTVPEVLWELQDRQCHSSLSHMFRLILSSVKSPSRGEFAK